MQMLPGHERTKVDEPMDTIFVKQVRANSPAAEAGLRTGDRVVSVDGTPTRGEQYASVVQRIQQAGPWLRLLVVSKEDDILQRVREIFFCIRMSSNLSQNTTYFLLYFRHSYFIKYAMPPY